LPITKDMILRRGEWRDKVPVVKTSNYREDASKSYNSGDNFVIDLPALRSEGTPKK